DTGARCHRADDISNLGRIAYVEFGREQRGIRICFGKCLLEMASDKAARAGNEDAMGRSRHVTSAVARCAAPDRLPPSLRSVPAARLWLAIPASVVPWWRRRAERRPRQDASGLRC